MNSAWTDPRRFVGSIITDWRDAGQVHLAVDDYKLALLCVLDQILSRYERNNDYHFLDTKLSLVTGKDFADDDPIRGRNTIFSWIQGRGLEALAGHDWWVREQDDLDAALKADIHQRSLTAISQVLDQMERLRSANGGRLYFMMTPQGQPLRVDEYGKVLPLALPASLPTSLSEMFYSKGMMAAGKYLARQDIMDSAEKLFLQVWHDVCHGGLYNDQQQLDVRNPVRPAPGRKGHGGRMIAIGAAALFLQCTGKTIYRDIGFECIDYILKLHIRTEAPSGPMQQYDMWEFVNEGDNQPYIRDNRLHSDSGHAAEFVGLAMKLIGVIESMGMVGAKEAQKVASYKAVLPKVLGQNFRNGFSAKGYGICKSFDLIGRKPINDDMPWWPLPEAIRAGMLAATMTQGSDKDACAEIAATCASAFSTHFVRRNLGLMASQTINAEGKVVDVIPATPDADPAYHTGLSIIDAIDAMQRKV